MGRITSSARTDWFPSALAPAGVLVTLLVWAAPASGALDIRPYFYMSESEYPGFDLDAAGLISLFAEAESIYEDIIYDSHTIWIDYWYEDLAGNTLGSHELVFEGGNPWRETRCNIRIDTIDGGTERDWFIDGSPDDHSEFNMGQVLYRDLSSEEQGIAFNGSTPDVFEAGYSGAATDPAAIERLDMLTTILHEVGHALGMAAANDATVAETADGDYDVDPGFVGGAAMAVNHAPPDNIAHVPGADMVMQPGLAEGTRYLPSAADFFSMAAGHDYGIVFAPRRDYLGGWEFTDPGNWIGGEVSNLLAHSYVRRNGGVTPYAVAQTYFQSSNLSVLEGSWVTTDDTIEIYETTTIDGTGAVDGTSRIRVQSNGSLETEDLVIGFAGVLELIGGSADVDAEASVRYGGRIEGNGTILVTERLTNNGVIAAVGGALALGTPSPDSVEVWELADSATGRVEAVDGDMFIHGMHYRDFRGTMVIGAGRTITMDRLWRLASDGRLELNGAAGSPAELAGADTLIRGLVEVDGEAVISGPSRFYDAAIGGADIFIPDVSDRLRLTGPTTFTMSDARDVTGHGTLEQAGDFTISGDNLTIRVDTFDWGNSDLGQRNDTLVKGARFRVNSVTTGTPDNEYRGRINLQNGTLEVNTDDPWTLPVASPDSDLPEGVLIFGEHKKKSPSTVAGQQLTVGGKVLAFGELGVIDAPFVTTPTATISVYKEAELELRQSTAWNGGTISGDGGIRQIGDARVVGWTQIATSYYDFDGDDDSPSQTTIDPSRILQINSTSIENGGADSFDGVVNVNGGELAINIPFPSSWTLGQSGALNLTSIGGTAAAVAGSPMVVSGGVTTTGHNKILSTVTFRESAKVVATAPGDVLRLRGHTDYDGGSYTGSGGIIQDATAFVNAPTTIELGFFDMDGPTDANGEEKNCVELHTDLTLNVDRIDISDNRFNGELEITDPATFTVNTPTPWTMAGSMEIVGPPGTQVTVAGAEVVLEADVYIEQQNLLLFEADVSGPGNFTGGGDYEILDSYDPGSSPAVVTSAGSVSFADSARLLLDIGGTVAGTQYDRLSVNRDVTLDGTVVFRFTDSFAPQENDTFDVIVAGGDTSSMLGDEDILIQNLAPGFLYDVGFEVASGNNVFRLTALNDAVVASSISGRHIFYNNSVFDLPADGRTDDDAVAPDKEALLPGETATLENYTSYDKGIRRHPRSGRHTDRGGLPV